MFMNYKGHELKPIGNILGGWKVKVSTMSYEKDQLCFENYIYADFYKQAKKQHESCDIYEYNGEWYIPTNNCLCYVDKEKANKHLKRIEEYSKWYHIKGGK